MTKTKWIKNLNKRIARHFRKKNIGYGFKGHLKKIQIEIIDNYNPFPELFFYF